MVRRVAAAVKLGGIVAFMEPALHVDVQQMGLHKETGDLPLDVYRWICSKRGRSSTRLLHAPHSRPQHSDSALDENIVLLIAPVPADLLRQHERSLGKAEQP
jgi:hypothetical protein